MEVNPLLALFLAGGMVALGEYAIYRVVIPRRWEFPVGSMSEIEGVRRLIKEFRESNCRGVESITSRGQQVANNISYRPLADALRMQFVLSEEFSWHIADEPPNLISEERKRNVDNAFEEFLIAYKERDKLLAYDASAKMFGEIVGKLNAKPLPSTFTKELQDAARQLPAQRISLFEVLSRYVQQRWDNPYVTLYLNVINKVLYVMQYKSGIDPVKLNDFYLAIRPSLGDFAKAICKNDRLLLYRSYEMIMQEAHKTALSVE